MSVHEDDPVLQRLHELRQDSKRAERVYHYVATGHDADCQTLDYLWVLREAPNLALELHGGPRDDAIAAIEKTDGVYRYAVWQYNHVHEALGDDPESFSWQPRSGVTEMLKGREPRVRLREDTPLEDLEAPSDWNARQTPGRTYNGP